MVTYIRTRNFENIHAPQLIFYEPNSAFVYGFSDQNFSDQTLLSQVF